MKLNTPQGIARARAIHSVLDGWEGIRAQSKYNPISGATEVQLTEDQAKKVERTYKQICAYGKIEPYPKEAKRRRLFWFGRP